MSPGPNPSEPASSARPRPCPLTLLPVPPGTAGGQQKQQGKHQHPGDQSQAHDLLSHGPLDEHSRPHVSIPDLAPISVATGPGAPAVQLGGSGAGIDCGRRSAGRDGHRPENGRSYPPTIFSVNVTLSTAEALRTALAGLLDGLPPKQAAQAVDRLIANYRGTTPTDAPVLRDRSDVAAYAAYRMPATFEAVRSALAALREAAPSGYPPPTRTSAAAPARRPGPSPGPGRGTGRPSSTGPSPPSSSAGNWPGPPVSRPCAPPTGGGPGSVRAWRSTPRTW